MFEDELSPLPSIPISGPALPFGQASAPMAPIAPAKPGIDWTRLIGPLATMALAATGHPNAAIGAGVGTMRNENIRRQEQDRADAYAYQQQQIDARRQQQVAEQEAKRQAGIQQLITQTATQARTAKTKDDYDGIVNAAEALGGQFYGLRPNSIRALVPYRAPNANEILRAAGEQFLKNPANKDAIDQGKLDGSILADIHGDGKPVPVPVVEALKATGAQIDPTTGKLLVFPKGDRPANVQDFDLVYTGLVGAFQTDKGRPPTDAERGELALKAKEQLAKAGKEGTASVIVQPPAEKPLTRYQRLSAERQLRSDADKVLEPIRDMNRQVMVMRAGMDQIRATGRLDAGTQAIINTFNRIMEPGSVTREAEYLRTTLGQPLFESLSGRWQSLTKGGAGVTPESLGLLVELAENIVDSLASGADARLDDLRGQAEEYRLPHQRIVPRRESYRLPPRRGAGKPAPSTGAVIVTAPDGKTYRFATQEQADAFKRAAGIK